MKGRLAGKTAIVTGAGRGIGEATAHLFAAEGAAVMIAESDEQSGQAVTQDILDSGGRAIFVATDVTDAAAVDWMTEQTEREFGPVDILVNNAGKNVFHAPLEMPRAAWEECMRLDLEAFWLCARAVLPGMKKRTSGAIINMGSVHSFQAMKNSFPYAVAKHAVIGLTRSLAIEFAASNIRVNAIAPGYIETPNAFAYWQTFPDPAAERQRTHQLHPPGRLGLPKEVAYTALFLASDEAPFINGATIVIDGGRSLLYHD